MSQGLCCKVRLVRVTGGFVPMRVSAARDLLGPGNGAASLGEMRAQIGRYRPIAAGEDPEIGCILIRDPRFFPEDAAFAPPPGFAPSIMQGKRYDLAGPAAAAYFGDLLGLLLGAPADLELGQQAFKAVVADAYRRQCAITGTHIPPVLQAAHLRPVGRGGGHRLDNGLLLRSDVHIMFVQGYLGVDPRHRLVVSPRLREEFGNGNQFYAKAGTAIDLPACRADQPHREFLGWHLDEVFKAS